jgi:hypothetical protein
VSEDLDQRDLAVRRLGATWKARLAWTVHEFLRRDLTRCRPEELVALGYDLRSLPPPLGTLTRSAQTPLPPATVQQIHEEVTRGLARLLSTEGAGLRGGWTLPPPTAVRLVRVGDAIRRVQESRDEAAAIVAAIGELLVHAGDDLRACPVCARPFVRQGRRRFCSERCSMKVRNDNRPPRPKKRSAR